MEILSGVISVLFMSIFSCGPSSHIRLILWGNTLLQQFIVSILKVKQLQTAVNISTWFQAGFSSVLSAPVTASWEH